MALLLLICAIGLGVICAGPRAPSVSYRLPKGPVEDALRTLAARVERRERNRA